LSDASPPPRGNFVDMPAVNRGVVVAGWVAFGGFGVTAVLALAGASPHFCDWFISWLQAVQSVWLMAAMKTITTIGEWYSLMAVCLVLLIIPRTRMHYGVPLAAVTVISGGLNAALKVVIREPRPDGHRLIAISGFSFPSGHAMISAAFVAMAVFLVLAFWRSRPSKIVVSALLIVMTGLIGTSRVYLGVHWPLDILGGYLAGFAVFVLIVWLWLRLWPAANTTSELRLTTI